MRNNKEAFRDRFLEESNKNRAELLTYDELKEKASSIFNEDPLLENLLPTFDITTLLECESNPILSKPIVGKDDVDIAAMIKKLGNSDWVKAGRTFYEKNDGICPFCQQKTLPSFQKSLEDYFDESYSQDIEKIDKLFSQYTAEVESINNKLQSILSNSSRFLDRE